MIAQGVAKAFIDCDCDLLEINPLVEDPQGQIWALDAKMSIDDNALFRHPELAAILRCHSAFKKRGDGQRV